MVVQTRDSLFCVGFLVVRPVQAAEREKRPVDYGFALAAE